MKAYLVDAFTEQMNQGNPAVVVLDHHVTKNEMQASALHFNVSETVFYDGEQAYYFTPTTEIDFCGHATLALAWVLNASQTFRIKTNVGSIELEKVDDNWFMRQIKPQFETVQINEAELLSCLQIQQEDLGETSDWIKGYTGNWDLFVPIRSKKVLDGVNPDFSRLSQFLKTNQLISVHLYTLEPLRSDIFAFTRNFAPIVGLNEDWVTGSSNGALGAYLFQTHKTLKSSFIIQQGNPVYKEGFLYLNILPDGRVQVGGKAYIHKKILH